MRHKKLTAILLAAAIAAAGTALPAENCNGFAVSVSAASKKSSLGAPKGIKASAAENSVTLTWKSVKGAEAYIVYLFNSDTKSYEDVKTVKTCSAKITGIELDSSIFSTLLDWL